MVQICNARAVQVHDLPMLLAWRNHPDIRRYMLTQHEITLDEHINWFNRVNQDPTRRLLIVEDQEQILGFVQFSGVQSGGVAEWGFHMKPDAPKGTGRKVGTVALDHAFNVLQLHKVCGQALDFNNASIGFHLALGFSQEGVLRDQCLIQDKYHGLVCFGLISHEWLPGNTDPANP